MSDSTRITKRLPALDQTHTQVRPSSFDIRTREQNRPGFHFSLRDNCEAFIASYPDLTATFANYTLDQGGPLASAGADPMEVIHDLAVSAHPPYPWPHTDLNSITALVDEFITLQHPTLRWELARLHLLISRQADIHNRRDLRTMRCGWDLFHDRLLDHLHEEETLCFPLCRRLAEHNNDALPARTECARLLSLMSESHVQALAEIDDVLVLARRASLAVLDPVLGVIVTGLVAMRDALIVHTDLENRALLPRCIQLALSRTWLADPHV